MDHKKAMEDLLSIEDRMDVTALTYRGMHLWPWVRQKLWYWGLYPEVQPPIAPLTVRHTSQVMSQNFFRPEVYLPYLGHSKRHRDNLALLSKAGSVDVLFFSREEDYADQFGGRYYNRHLDPLIERIKKDHTHLKLELVTGNTARTLPRFEHTHFFDTVDYLRCDAQRSIIRAFMDDENQGNLSGSDALSRVLAPTRFRKAVIQQALLLEGERLHHYKRYFLDILTVLRPKVVFQVCYYYEIAMGLIAACRSLGIPMVDVQHGKQGQYHGMYTHWKQVPQDGFSLLPDYFWCWGCDSADNIQKWMPAQSAHQAVVGGSAWLAKWVEEGSLKLPLDATMQHYVANLSKQKKVILVSLQPTEQLLPPSLIEAMQASPLEWKWLLRLHPRQKNEIAKLFAQLQALNIFNVEVEKATLIPLYLLLKGCNRHVTQWSSVCYEALSYGIPSVIIHPAGKTLYNDYIERGYFSYAEDAEGMLRALSIAYTDISEDRPYIVTDPVHFEGAWKRVMSHHAQYAPAI